ncbi:MAG: hypothetical protein ISS66_10420 [Desulfobacteraceae bacterium]|nr:hypothetical protein [Desulfobacteraceae bacterium]
MSKIPSLAGVILKGRFSLLNNSNLGVKKKMANKPISHFSRTHYSIIPVFHYSNCERSELTCVRSRDPQEVPPGAYTLLESEVLRFLKADGHLPLQRQVTGKEHRDTAGIIAKNCMETGS